MVTKFIFPKPKKIRTIVLISNFLQKNSSKKVIREYEKNIKEKLFCFETDPDYFIFFIHLKNEQNIVKLFENAKKASSVLFMDDVEEKDITFFVEQIFKSKTCQFYYKGEIGLTHALDFTEELECFLPLTKREMVTLN